MCVQANPRANQISLDEDIRWTFIFLHQPIWDNDAWLQIEELLKDHPYTVFAGHKHQYLKVIRNGRNYYQLATTGGLSSLTGSKDGSFDHIVWVTMQSDGPVIANLLLDGIMSDDPRAEIQPAPLDALIAPFEHIIVEPDDEESITGSMQVDFENLYTQPLSVKTDWSFPQDSSWSIEPMSQKIEISQASAGKLSWQVAFHGDSSDLSRIKPFPVLMINAKTPTKTVVQDYKMFRAFGIDQYLALSSPKMLCTSVNMHKCYLRQTKALKVPAGLT